MLWRNRNYKTAWLHLSIECEVGRVAKAYYTQYITIERVDGINNFLDADELAKTN